MQTITDTLRKQIAHKADSDPTISKAELGRMFGVSPRTVGRSIEKFGKGASKPIASATPPQEMPPVDDEATYSYAITPKVATLYRVVGDKTETVTVESSRADAFSHIVSVCRELMLLQNSSNNNALAALFAKYDVRAHIQSLSHGRVTVDPHAGTVKFTGESGREYEFTGILVTRLVEKVRNGEDVKSIMAFADKLSQNPSFNITESVYEFLEACDVRIDEDGDIIAYKKITLDFKDVRTGTFDNSVGAVVREDRNQVDPDMNRTCAKGLHVCSLSYVPYYSGDVIVRVKVNPKDVVAIPSDYYAYDGKANATRAKMRCCEYKVLDVVNSIDG